MKKIRKIMAGLLGLLMFISTGLSGVSVLAATETYTIDSNNVIQLENGVYCIPLNFVTDYSSGSGVSTSVWGRSLYKSALVVAKDGNYTVTLRMDGTCIGEKSIKILDDNYCFDDIVTPAEDGSYKAVVDDNAYDTGKFWRTDVSETKNETTGYSDYTFSVDDLSEDVYMVIHQGTESYDHYCKITFSYTQAVELPETVSDGEVEWSFVLDNSYSYSKKLVAVQIIQVHHMKKLYHQKYMILLMKK
ncbi:MAG: hypothetical protein LUE92_09515 [Clostridiales bacterium]|nr:hypothetical protein [Clostridiales bacterium]